MAMKHVSKGRMSDRLAGGIGIAASVVLFWVIGEFAEVDAPDYVVTAAGGLIMYVVTKIEEAMQ